MQNHLLDVEAKKAGGPTWETVRYMVSIIQYGGRITDDYDQLLMDTYADKYFHSVRPACSLGPCRSRGRPWLPVTVDVDGCRKLLVPLWQPWTLFARERTL